MQEHVHSTVNITPMGLDGRMKLPMPTDTIPSISSGSLAHLLISRFGKLPPRVPWIYSPKLDENDWWWVVRFCTGSAIELLWKSRGVDNDDSVWQIPKITATSIFSGVTCSIHTTMLEDFSPHHPESSKFFENVLSTYMMIFKIGNSSAYVFCYISAVWSSINSLLHWIITEVCVQ